MLFCAFQLVFIPLQPCRFFPMSPPTSTSTEDSYVPMSPQTAAFALGSHDSSDDYIPMNSGSISSPLPELPLDLEPPPVNRDLKPQRKSKPLLCGMGEQGVITVWKSFPPKPLCKGSTTETHHPRGLGERRSWDPVGRDGEHCCSRSSG